MNKNNLKKEDLIKNFKKKTGFSNNISKKAINDFLEVLIQNIKKNNLNIKNIGSFKLIRKNKRVGRNPKTKEIFDINSRKSLSFIASKKLLKKLNEI